MLNTARESPIQYFRCLSKMAFHDGSHCGQVVGKVSKGVGQRRVIPHIAINIPLACQVTKFEYYFKEFYWQRHQARWKFWGERHLNICFTLFGRNCLRRSLGDNSDDLFTTRIASWESPYGSYSLVALLSYYLPHSSWLSNWLHLTTLLLLLYYSDRLFM